ncbi:MAG: WD40 repeat domain-containing protein, partial [Pseudomonadota bacterium]
PMTPSEEASLSQNLCRSPRALGVLLHDIAVRERCKVLLFVDQLEEMLTMGTDRAVQEAFLRAVCGVADHPSSPVRAVFTVRDDFVGHLGGGSEVAAALSRVFVLRRPGKEALEEVLARPLTTVGHSYDDPALVAEMVDSVKNEPACLPLLQFAGQMLWERRDKGKRRLCRATYEAMGGVAGSLAEHADGALAGMTTAQVELVRQLLLRLVTSAGTRRVVPVGVAVAGLGPGAEEVLDKLTLARLLTVRRAAEGQRQQGKGRDGSAGRSGAGGVSSCSGSSDVSGSNSSSGGSGGEAVLELVHESLVCTWARLARWLEESREELAVLAEVSQAADLWEKRGRRDQEVWDGDALADARRKLARVTTGVPAQVARFIQAGSRKEQRQRRRKRALAAGTMAFLAIVAVWSLLRERETRAQKARAESRQAEAQREGAMAAFGRGDLLEARAKVRGSLETQDSLLGRALWWKLERDPLVWRKDFGTIAYSVSFSPDGRTIAVGTVDGLVHLVDTETLDETRLRGFEKEILSLAFSPDGMLLAAATNVGEIGHWHLQTGAFSILEGHTEAVSQIVFSPDGRQLFSASWDNTIRRWNATSDDAGGVLATLPSPLLGIAISSDGRLVAAAGGDRTTRLLDAATGSAVRVVGGHDSKVSSVAFSPDGSTLATGSSDRAIRIWDTASGSLLALLLGHSDPVKQVAFAGGGKLLVSASYDKTVRLWDVAAKKELSILTRHSDKIAGLAIHPRGLLAVSASADQTVRLFRAALTAATPLPVGHASEAIGLALSPDGKYVASASGDGTARIWEIESGRQQAVLVGHTGRLQAVAYSPDGKLLATGAFDNSVILWNVATAAPQQVLVGHRSIVSGVVFSPGGLLASASPDDTIRLWDLDTGQSKTLVTARTAPPNGLEFSADGKLLAGYDHKIVSIDPASGRESLLGWQDASGEAAPRQKQAERLFFDAGGRWAGMPADGCDGIVVDLTTGERKVLVGHRGVVRWL